MSFLTSLFGDDENAQRAAEADAKLRAMNEDRAKELGSDWFSQVQKNYETQVTFDPKQQEAQVNDAFKEGLDEGAGNVTGFISGTFNFIGKALAAVLLGIPVWVWLIVGGVAFFYLGGGVWLRRKISKA